jgi:hypothetical protein
MCVCLVKDPGGIAGHTNADQTSEDWVFQKMSLIVHLVGLKDLKYAII